MDGDSDSDAALIDLPSTGGGTVTQFAGPRPRNGRPGPSLRPAEARTTGSHRAGGLTVGRCASSSGCLGMLPDSRAEERSPARNQPAGHWHGPQAHGSDLLWLQACELPDSAATVARLA
jgi:hypothetical protein